MSLTASHFNSPKESPHCPNIPSPKTLQHALIATSDPDERIRLAHELNTLISHEERINGRARRKRARRPQKSRQQQGLPTSADRRIQAEEIDIVYPAVAVVPRNHHSRDIRPGERSEIEEVAATTVTSKPLPPAPRTSPADRPNPNGWTRTCAAVVSIDAPAPGERRDYIAHWDGWPVENDVIPQRSTACATGFELDTWDTPRVHPHDQRSRTWKRRRRGTIERRGRSNWRRE